MKTRANSAKPSRWGLHFAMTLVGIVAFAAQPIMQVSAQNDLVITPTPISELLLSNMTSNDAPASTPSEMPDVSGFVTSEKAAKDIQAAWTMMEIDQAQVSFIDKDHGFIYMNAKLYWTNDRSKNWIDITPSDIGTPRAVSIQFLDQYTGMMLADLTEEEGEPSFALFTTHDSGISWSRQVVMLPYPPDELLSFESTTIFFIDASSGWISLKINSGSNFSRGMLFRTDNGGASWTYQSVPFGGPVYFSSSELGWIAGGPAGDQLYDTKDGGNTWESVELPEIDASPLVSIQLPHYFDETDGLLAVLAGQEEYTEVMLYKTSDSGATWILGTTIAIEPSSDNILPVSYSDKKLKKILFSNDKSIITSDGKSESRIQVEQGIPSTPQKLIMLTDQVGFSQITQADCQADNPGGNGKIHCQKEFQLLHTENGGKTWSPVVLPEVNTTSVIAKQDFSVETMTTSSDVTSTAPNTTVFIGQGFDKCDVAGYDQLLTWMQSGPYRAVNLYIGGISRACTNAALTSTFVHSVSLQGWKFIPTWVGPQAPCSGLKYPMSPDPATAYGQGVENAIQAVEALYLLGLTSSNKTGGAVYYDMEYYNAKDPACAAAVRSFMNGWTAQLNAMGNISGVYGATSINQLDNIFAAANPPLVIWPARWNSTEYNQSASVWEIPDLDNGIYINHQRIRQYAGGHNETWGNVTMNIDSNVLDGVVAIPLVSQPAACPPTTSTQSYVCNPIISPAYTNTCNSGWYPIIGFNGLTTFLSENVTSLTSASNFAIWQPNLSADGYYRVEAFVASHGSANVTCSSGIKSYGKDSSKANYVVTDRNGARTTVVVDQYPIDNDWVSLGSYFFASGGNGGRVGLTNATGELQYSTNISVGAVRFIAVDPKVSTISPTTKVVGSDAFTLTVNGYNFDSNSVVRWNGSDRSTILVTSKTITAQISQADIASIGINQVTVINTAAGNVESDPVDFSITSFADVPAYAWYWRYVEGFYAQGITTGCGVNPAVYCPDNAVTRAEMAVFLLRALNGIVTPTPTQTGMFADVPVVDKEWMQPWIEEFYLEGMTMGCAVDPAMYCPERKLTRAEAAVFILKAIHGKDHIPPEATGVFSDVPVAGKEWMEPWVEEFFNEGITTGCAQDPLKFCPDQSVTRAELATFIDRAFGFPLLP